jgi:hypothetical protein
MKTLILTSILLTGLTVFSYAKPLKEIYSIQEPILTEESYIDDIPFNTEKIYCEYLAALITEQYRNEQNISDLHDIIKPDYSIIYPVKPTIPVIQVRSTDPIHETHVCPGFSL